MLPAARTQAAIELLDEIIDAARAGGAAADTLIARYFKTRRFAGSADRRAIRELVYRAIRRSGEAPALGRAAVLGLAEGDPALRAHFGAGGHGPSAIQSGEAVAEAGAVPFWLEDRLDPHAASEGECAALLGRAPLDLRVNSLRGSRVDAMAAFPEARPTPHSPLGLRLPEGFAVEATAAWRTGLVEVQDEGSQLVALASRARAGMDVVDLCAGAGGKTLALAALMGGGAGILACDVDRVRLSRLPPRLARNGVDGVETRLLDPGRERDALSDMAARADIVLVDAPCSGSGTWRRNPEARWRLTPDRLARLAALQAGILDVAAGLVKPGGCLVYAVCSLLAAEGRGQAEAFAARYPGFAIEDLPIAGGRATGAGRLYTPFHDMTDGFFIARWRAAC